MSHGDYGLTKEDETLLYNLCTARQEDIQRIVHEACEAANPQLAPWIEFSLKNGKSYDRTSIEYKWIPATIDDFYGYRRKAIAILHGMLGFK